MKTIHFKCSVDLQFLLRKFWEQKEWREKAQQHSDLLNIMIKRFEMSLGGKNFTLLYLGGDGDKLRHAHLHQISQVAKTIYLFFGSDKLRASEKAFWGEKLNSRPLREMRAISSRLMWGWDGERVVYRRHRISRDDLRVAAKQTGRSYKRWWWWWDDVIISAGVAAAAAAPPAGVTEWPPAARPRHRLSERGLKSTTAGCIRRGNKTECTPALIALLPIAIIQKDRRNNAFLRIHHCCVCRRG